MLSCILVAASFLLSANVRAQESDAARCQDGVDDDGDGAVDCGDSECALFVFCSQAGYSAQVGPTAVVAQPGYAPQQGYVAQQPQQQMVTSSHPTWVLVGIGFGLFGLAWVLDIAVTGATT